jgi:hypothetical protein
MSTDINARLAQGILECEIGMLENETPSDTAVRAVLLIRDLRELEKMITDLRVERAATWTRKAT